MLPLSMFQKTIIDIKKYPQEANFLGITFYKDYYLFYVVVFSSASFHNLTNQFMCQYGYFS